MPGIIIGFYVPDDWKGTSGEYILKLLRDGQEKLKKLEKEEGLTPDEAYARYMAEFPLNDPRD